ncbi:hypothetical protein Tco_1090474 [Tanacetum coccineum]|uniref:Uncharacterized protein n=1 Tax=Tanacetum coccineum TaxID=301880 RepID=A0ABQ5I4K9_9ASTR
MSTPTYVYSETITQADEAQSSRVPVPLPDDPYVAVRQAQLVDTESEPKEAPSEAGELQSLGSRVPLMGKEFETFEQTSTRTDSSHSSASLDSTTPLLPDHPLTHRYRSSYETSLSSSLTLSVQKRYRGTSELIIDTDSEGDKLREEDTKEDKEDESLDADDDRKRSDDKGYCLGYEDHGLDDEIVSEPLGLGYEALRHRELAVEEDQVPSTFEVDPEDSIVYTDIPAYAPPVAPVQTLPSPEWLSDSLPISPSSLDHIQCLDALPPTLIMDIDRDERATVTFRALWRPMLALEAWAGRGDTRLTDMSRDRYDDHRLIHDMLVQQVAMQHELQEMRGRVIDLDQKMDHR